MRIRMLTGISGADFNLVPKEETDRFSDAEAIRLIESGQAVPVADAPVERAAKAPAPEKRGRK